MPERSGLLGDDRAVSESLGFVLVVSLVLLSATIVSVFGLAALQDARDFERVNNGERAIDVLADNVEDVYVDGAPSRATEIKLDDAGLTVRGSTTIEVTVDGTTYSETVTPIVMRIDDATMVYEGTAVLRVEDAGGVTTVREPSFTLGTDRTLVPLVVTQRDGRSNLGGTTTVLIETEAVERRVLSTRDGSPTVPVTVHVQTTPERAPAWDRALEERLPGGVSCAVTGGDVTCDPYSTSEVVVSRTTVNVSLLN